MGNVQSSGSAGPGKRECRRRALLACDWFVNTQVVMKEPALTADHGRIVYNHHLPSGLVCRGLSWSHGRAIMCLLAGHAITGRQEYFDAAVRCGEYLRFGLQWMDSRDKRLHGLFREEVPASRFCYPRDGIEGAFGLLQLHLATGQRDYLERAEIFADWYLRVVVDPKEQWPRGAIYFDRETDSHPMKFFQAGGAPFFWHLYQVTRRKRYLDEGLRMLADGLFRWLDDSGAILSPTKDRHHSIVQDDKGYAINDDGASIALTCAHKAFAGRRKSSRYLDAALAYGDWLVDRCPRPAGRFAANGMHAIVLTELTAVTGIAKYATFARRLMGEQIALQIESPDQLDRHGAFRGEDERTDSYVKGSSGEEFITTRTTAYSALALFRLLDDDACFGPSYSALGFAKPFRKS